MSILIPRTAADLTPDWMTDVLRDGGYLDANSRVTDVTVENIGIGRGSVGARWWGVRALDWLDWIQSVEERAALWGDLFERGWDVFWASRGPSLPDEFAEIGIGIRNTRGRCLLAARPRHSSMVTTA